MGKRSRRAVFFLLTSLGLVSCSLTNRLRTRLQAFLNTGEPSQLPTPIAEPIETQPVESAATPTQMDVRVVGQRVLAESESPAYIIDGAWPNLDGPEAMVAPFNAEVDRMVDEFQAEFLAAVNELSPAQEELGQAPLSSLRFDYLLTNANGRSFSFLLQFDQYIAISVHPVPFSRSLNYDAHQAEFIGLEQLFLPGVDPVQEIGPRIEPVLESRDFGYEAGRAAEVLRQRENWNLLPGGLQINFDVYEIGPYAVGPQSVLIPWEDLAGLVDPHGPAGGMIE